MVAQPPCQAPPSGLDTEEVLSWEDQGLTLSHRSCDSAWSTPAIPWLGFSLKPSAHSSLLSLPATLLCTEVWDRGPTQGQWLLKLAQDAATELCGVKQGPQRGRTDLPSAGPRGTRTH